MDNLCAVYKISGKTHIKLAAKAMLKRIVNSLIYRCKKNLCKLIIFPYDLFQRIFIQIFLVETIPPVSIRPSYKPILAYCKTGADQIAIFRTILKIHGIHIENFLNILDFGCATGRHISHLRQYNLKTKITGFDVLQKPIDWARKNIPFSEFQCGEDLPPTKFESNYFDFIYAYSVFTHFDEKTHLLWLHELARILDSGGYLLVTIAGKKTIEVNKQKNPVLLKSLYNIDDTVQFLQNIPDFYFYTPNKDEKNHHWGNTLILSEYVKKHWTREFDFVCYVEDAIRVSSDYSNIQTAPEAAHDVVLLRKI
tara:strand:- start:424 stop:1350 length:927 start_codon:yes stop_codon:yes gene_type:complete